MLTSIAAAAYGDSKKWKKIAEANPSVNPNRMAPGTKLVIPVLASYTQASSNSVSSAAAAASLDPQTQYQVEPNDSLYRISMKLYGKATHVDQLYQDNKDTIGSDPRRLKLNTVLKLTDPPTTSTTASR
jgi:nucleoid-associated protein YgaU